MWKRLRGLLVFGWSVGSSWCYRRTSLWLFGPYEGIHAVVLRCLLEEVSERVDLVNTVGFIGHSDCNGVPLND